MSKKLFLALLFVAACTAKPDGNAGVEHVPPEAFESRINSEAIIVDVRTQQEFHTGYIEGAVNIDYKADNFSERIDTLDRSRNYLLYCASGARSSRASDMMKGKGFKSITTLEGGIEAWAAAGKPVITE